MVVVKYDPNVFPTTMVSEAQQRMYRLNRRINCMRCQRPMVYRPTKVTPLRRAAPPNAGFCVPCYYDNLRSQI